MNLHARSDARFTLTVPANRIGQDSAKMLFCLSPNVLYSGPLFLNGKDIPDLCYYSNGRPVDWELNVAKILSRGYFI